MTSVEGVFEDDVSVSAESPGNTDTSSVQPKIDEPPEPETVDASTTTDAASSTPTPVEVVTEEPATANKVMDLVRPDEGEGGQS